MSKRLQSIKIQKSRELKNKIIMFDETKTGGNQETPITPEDEENLEVPGEETPVKEESEIPVDELADDLA